MSTAERALPEDPDSPSVTASLAAHVLRVAIDPRMAVYSTIILMATFALLDEGTTVLTLSEWFYLVAEAAAPLLAITVAHAFSEALAYEVRHHTPLTHPVRKAIVLHNLQMLYIVVPVAVLALPFLLFHIEANTAINVVLLLAGLSLVGWGLYAARRVGKIGWRRLYYAVSYPVIGIGVVVLEILLKKA